MYSATWIHRRKPWVGREMTRVSETEGDRGLRQNFLSLAARKGVVRRMAESAGSFHFGLGDSDWTGIDRAHTAQAFAVSLNEAEREQQLGRLGGWGSWVTQAWFTALAHLLLVLSPEVNALLPRTSDFSSIK